MKAVSKRSSAKAQLLAARCPSEAQQACSTPMNLLVVEAESWANTSYERGLTSSFEGETTI